MATEQYEAAMSIAASHPGMRELLGPRAQSEVVTAETDLQIDFPRDYRRFLIEHGCGSFGPLEINGLVGDPDYNRAPNVVWLTLQRRNSFGWPIHLLPISDDGYGSEYVMDLREGPDPAVWLWPGGTPFEEAAEKEYPSFGHFLLDVAKHMSD